MADMVNKGPLHRPPHAHTPKLVNQAEIEIGIFSRQCLGNRRIPDLNTLHQEAKAGNRRMNRDRVKIAWKFNRKAAAGILHAVKDVGRRI